jgi:hypothetical protein
LPPDDVPPPLNMDSDATAENGMSLQPIDSKLANSCDASASTVTPSQCTSSIEEQAVNPVPAPIPEDEGADADVNVGTKPKFEKMKLRENRRKTFIAEAFIEDEPDLPPVSAPSKPSAVTTDRRRRAMQSMPLSMPVNFGPLDISVLKKYKKCFKVPAKANACKEELLSVIAKHFLQLKVDEAKTVKSCIKKVRRMHKLADI